MGPTMGGTMEKQRNRSPWRFLVLAVIVVAMIAVVGAGITYLQQGIGGVVPVLMIVVAPMLAVYYVWYLAIRSDD